MDISLLANIFRGGDGDEQQVTEEEEEAAEINGCSQDGVDVMVFLFCFFLYIIHIYINMPGCKREFQYFSQHILFVFFLGGGGFSRSMLIDVQRKEGIVIGSAWLGSARLGRSL